MNLSRARIRRGLSARLLVLTIVFVMVSEVLIYVPSIARFRHQYLAARIADAHLATLALEIESESTVAPELAAQLLAHSRLLGIELWQPPRAHLMMGEYVNTDASFDLRKENPWVQIREAFVAMWMGGNRTIRVYGQAPMNPTLTVEVYLDESELATEMFDYSRRILTLSVIISLITASFVYLTLQLLMVRSLRRMTASLMAFRERPEDPETTVAFSNRQDEIGVMEQELGRMQSEIRGALAQKSRLAALGTAVSKINHDLRSILSTASLASERLTRIDDPAVRRVAPLLVNSVEKAVQLCTQTQDLARGDQAVPRRCRFQLEALVDEVGAALAVGEETELEWHNEVDPGLVVDADRERIYRVLLNLGRNAIEAAGRRAEVTVSARAVGERVRVDVADKGPGISGPVCAHLFEPFAGSDKSGGTGLGLATSRDLVRAHGGDLVLVETGTDGTRFRFEIG